MKKSNEKIQDENNKYDLNIEDKNKYKTTEIRRIKISRVKVGEQRWED